MLLRDLLCFRDEQVRSRHPQVDPLIDHVVLLDGRGGAGLARLQHADADFGRDQHEDKPGERQARQDRPQRPA